MKIKKWKKKNKGYESEYISLFLFSWWKKQYSIYGEHEITGS